MKKRMAIILCAMLAAAGVLAGCGGNEQTESEAVSSTVESKAPSTSSEVKSDPNLPMTVAEQVYSVGKINTALLIVENMESPTIQTNINTLIQQDMIGRLNAYQKINAEYTGDLKSEVVRNDGKVLSIVTSGALSAPKAAAPVNVVYTTNIDLNTAKRAVTPVVEKASEIADILLSGKDYTVKGTKEVQEAVKKAMMSSKKETLVANLSATDMGLKDKEPICFSYQMDNSHVVIYMPVEHALGDFATLTVNLNRDEAKADAAQSSAAQTSSEASKTAASSTASGASSKAAAPASSAVSNPSSAATKSK